MNTYVKSCFFIIYSHPLMLFLKGTILRLESPILQWDSESEEWLCCVQVHNLAVAQGLKSNCSNFKLCNSFFKMTTFYKYKMYQTYKS